MIFNLRKKSSPFYFQRFRSLKRYGVFAIACSLFFSFISTAEEVARTRFSTLGIENGLSQSTVLSIEQDSLGYIWLATQDGLNRYDGVGVEVFKHQPLNENTISSSHISRLLFDDYICRNRYVYNMNHPSSKNSYKLKSIEIG